MDEIFEKSAGIIIFCRFGRERKYLILHYEEGHWDFPKGHIERDEDEMKAALRELKEETGIGQVEFAGNFKEIISYTYKRGGKKFHKKACFFLAETQTKKIKLSGEHTGYKWLPSREAHRLVTFDNAKELLRKADEYLKMK